MAAGARSWIWPWLTAGVAFREIVVGYDRPLRSSGFDLRRGSRLAVRRTVYTRDSELGTESALDISAATAIRWYLLDSLAKSATAVMTKSLGAGIALTTDGTDGSYDVAFAEADTKSLALGMYYGLLEAVVGGTTYRFAPYTVNVTAAPDLGE